MRVVRTTVEASVLAAGYLLGGTVGIGAALQALAIGPISHRTIPALALSHAPADPVCTERWRAEAAPARIRLRRAKRLA
jgi:hypothetical protein